MEIHWPEIAIAIGSNELNSFYKIKLIKVSYACLTMLKSILDNSKVFYKNIKQPGSFLN